MSLPTGLHQVRLRPLRTNGRIQEFAVTRASDDEAIVVRTPVLRSPFGVDERFRCLNPSLDRTHQGIAAFEDGIRAFERLFKDVEELRGLQLNSNVMARRPYPNVLRMGIRPNETRLVSAAEEYYLKGFFDKERGFVADVSPTVLWLDRARKTYGVKLVANRVYQD